MKVISAAAALTASPIAADPAYAQQAWKVVELHVTTNNFCFTTDHFRWVREEPGRFRIFDSINRKELMSAPMKPDGSVNAEMKNPYGNTPYKITVPPGSGPRAYELLDLRWVCRIRVEPTGAVQ